MNKKFALPKIFRGFYILLNIGFVIWLLLCKWVSHYNPVDSPTIFSLVSFTCLFALFGNLIFMVTWLFSSKKIRSLLSLITILICWSVCYPLIGINYLGRNNISASDVQGLKIMTWNVHMFDLGEWTQDKASKAKILKLIADESPDILCMEEYYWDAKDPSTPYTEILQQTGYPYVQFSKEYELKKSFITSNAGKNDVIIVGHAIFSKYPLRNQVRYPLYGKDYNMLSVEVVVDSSSIFCLNVIHLTSVGFGRKDMQYISDVKQNVEAQDDSQSKSLIKKLRNASARRAQLANNIDSLKKQMDYPKIICGDFNDVPGSYVYNTVKGDLADAFCGKGSGLGRTYRNIAPTLRIDYILYDKKALKIEGYNRPSVPLSDHFPVIANFSLIRKQNK